MESPLHDLPTLFKQLGLPSTAVDVQTFIARHAPLAGQVHLADAPFWTPSQASFLREECQDDADWAGVVDQLNLLLRAAR